MSITLRLANLADLALDRGQPELFKRIRRVAIVLAGKKQEESKPSKETREDYFDTDSVLNETIEDEREDEPPIEEIKEEEDPDGFGDEAVESPDDKQGDYGGFPVGAIGIKERRRGPYADVSNPDREVSVDDKVRWWKR